MVTLTITPTRTPRASWAPLLAIFVVLAWPGVPVLGDAAATRSTQASRVNPQGAAVKQFLDRIQEWVTFHNNVEKMVPPLKETTDQREIATRQAALAAALIKQRPNAREGDFFVKAVQPHLLRIVRQDWAKRAPQDRKALMGEGIAFPKVAVNTIYPTSIPLGTFPSNLLKALPELPREIEYRMIGRDLILRDTTGNVVIDIMRGVFPA